MLVKEIAKVCHEINRAYCEALGDDSQLPWEDTPEWQKDSAIKGVNFHIENPDSTPQQIHENWLKQKEVEGWKYGKVKDAEKKEHPCCVPYDKLPIDQKAKDYLFRTIVHQLKHTIPEMDHQ